MAKTILILILAANSAFSFCGFYVAKADTKLFNKASKVVYVRDENRSVLTMSNDYQGDLKEFAIVIPVPVVLKEKQIHVTENKLIDHLDSYTAPRLVEYFDEDPCQVIMYKAAMVQESFRMDTPDQKQAKKLGVTIEAEYTVGEYDILILSAKESTGLMTWLNSNGYKVPENAKKIVSSYIKQDQKFFVAKVNLEEQSKLGHKFLRPLQIAFESDKFDLPIRLGTVNADGPQDLFVFGLTRKGRIEPVNYKYVKLPTDLDVPTYVKEEFSDFYTSMFDQLVKRENMGSLILEYAWDMSWCDPCAADPLSQKQLKELGVFWLEDNQLMDKPSPSARSIAPPNAVNVYVSRYHVRYTAETFPDDLKFQVTNDRKNFQGRFILRHKWKGEAKCEQAKQYLSKIPQQLEQEAQNLARLTGKDINDIRKRMGNLKPVEKKEDSPWWSKIWN